MSKILERAVNDQLKQFLEKNGLLFEHQSGFRGSFSTDSCTINLTDFVKCEVSRGKMVGMVLIDLQKAFDTVNHSILLDKMGAMGIAPSSVSWFRSYLSERAQCVTVNGDRSEFLDVTCGVPQGSILGPQLFLLYINDLNVSISSCRLALYADDSALIFSHTDPGFIAETLSKDLSICKEWLCDNKLSLHVGKTECILFGSARKLKKVGDFRVTCGGLLVKRVTAVKYLGIHLDEKMKGTAHAGEIVKKCAGRISFLYRHSSMLDFYCRKTLCSALILPHFDYCCSSWYSSLNVQLRSKLDVLQRKVVRFIYSMDARGHVGTEHLRSLSWLSIPDRVRYFKVCHVFRIRNGLILLAVAVLIT